MQLIQTISAVDKDDPLGGQKFFFSLAAVNPNFTVQDNEGKFYFILFLFLFIYLFILFVATPAAYRTSRARGRV